VNLAIGVLLIAAVASTAQPRDAAPDGALQARFLKEAPLGWEKIRARELQVVGTLRMKISSLQGGKKVDSAKDRIIAFRRNGDLTSYSTTVEGGTGNTTIVVAPHYAFKIGRRSPDLPYSLQSLSFGDANVLVEEVKKGSYLWSVLSTPRSCYGEPMSDLIKSPGFAIRSISTSQDDAGEIVRVAFESGSKQTKFNFKDAWITMRPSQDWAIQKGEYNLSDDWRIIHENVYEKASDGKDRLSLSLNIYDHPKEKTRQFYDYTFEHLKAEAVPESAFSLSAYGMPEPDRPLAVNNRGMLHYGCGQ